MTEDQKATVVITEIAQPVHITLTKNTKGYSWEISIHNENLGECLALVGHADEQLKAKYGTSE